LNYTRAFAAQDSLPFTTKDSILIKVRFVNNFFQFYIRTFDNLEKPEFGHFIIVPVIYKPNVGYSPRRNRARAVLLICIIRSRCRLTQDPGL